ncbi:helix-turn-helix domain-containing protein [Subtercola lobariae]|uniref:XRE family transcriptional regulator n=1 Tax=Subtercola lobariae TaxID=1588641 RepID=A0A917BGM6_9MICO|nr:XRE family transcriptional regulator [Subtercola lobariae]GGF38375.1 XRE family transcriptional regulator [Subtercola lobariae]
MSATTEALDPQTRQLGAAIRAMRLSKSLTLVELARLANLSHPFLSQLERGHARPSMSSLERIARALETSQLDLLAEGAGGGQSGAAEGLAHAATSTEARVATKVLAAEGTRGPYAEGEGRLLVDARAKFQPMEFRGANGSFGDFYRHAEDEFVTVIEGDIVVDLEVGGLHSLAAGDSLYFIGGTPHRWRSFDGSPYRMLIVKQRFFAGENGEPPHVTLWSRAATEASFAPIPSFEASAEAPKK